MDKVEAHVEKNGLPTKAMMVGFLKKADKNDDKSINCDELYNALKGEFGEGFADEVAAEGRKAGVTKEMCAEGLPIDLIMGEFGEIQAKHVADGGKMAKEF